jgi:hypothetical protein
MNMPVHYTIEADKSVASYTNYSIVLHVLLAKYCLVIRIWQRDTLYEIGDLHKSVSCRTLARNMNGFEFGFDSQRYIFKFEEEAIREKPKGKKSCAHVLLITHLFRFY